MGIVLKISYMCHLNVSCLCFLISFFIHMKYIQINYRAVR